MQQANEEKEVNDTLKQSKIKRKRMPWWGITLLSIGGVIVITLGTVGGIYLYGRNHKYEPVIEDTINQSTDSYQTVRTKGKGLYDKDGNRFTLKGVNFGNWLIQEGYMSVNSIGVRYNEDGSYYKINEDGIIEEYEELYQQELDLALKNNPNLTDEQIKQLWSVYYRSYCQEEDFVNIKKLGLNTIRLPMYYRNFMEGDDGNLKMRDDAFELVDWFLENCKKNNLFAVLDMHGVEGGQSGYEHSGTRDILFWKNEKYQQDMCNLWKNIAKHYIEDRPDLAYTIAAYDLVNEPTDRNVNKTEKEQWDVFDKMYKAIREVDQKHIITMEGCWTFDTLPNPKDYGWEQVMYEYHFYNWYRPRIDNESFYAYQKLSLSKVEDYECPFYVGEFTFFDEEDEWVKWLNQYDDWGFSWTFWSYKIISVGYWESSWGLYNYKMNLFNEQKKLDVRTATYDEIYEVWSKQGTSETYKDTSKTYNAITKYFEQK